jgi:hypothetical protein
LPEHGKGLLFIRRFPEDRPAKNHDRVCPEDPMAFTSLDDRASFGLGQKPGIHERVRRQKVFPHAADHGAKRNPDLSHKLFSSRRG